MSGEAFKGQNFRCFLELGRRNDVGTGHINRIPLFVDNISISTGKMVMNAPIPFSGAVRGESLNLAFDIGQASKNISLSGTLMGMGIKKQKDADSLKDKSWIDSLRIVKESLFKGSDKGLDSASVIEETLRLKYQKPVRKYTVSSETEIPKLEVQEGFSIITLPDGSKKIFEVVEGQAKERTDLRV